MKFFFQILMPTAIFLRNNLWEDWHFYSYCNKSKSIGEYVSYMTIMTVLIVSPF